MANGIAPGTGVVAVVCAMPMELRPVAARFDDRRPFAAQVADGRGGVRGCTGRVGDRRVVAVVTGMGTELAERGTNQLFDDPVGDEIEHVVVAGITGALSGRTPIGTLVRPEVVLRDGHDVEHRPVHVGTGAARGAMWTTDRLTTDPAELAALQDRGVISLDMETAAIGAVCVSRGVPWSVVRAISDRADDGSVDAEVFGMAKQDGSPHWPSVARYVLTHPQRLPRLAAAGRDASAAARIAADAAIRAIATPTG